MMGDVPQTLADLILPEATIRFTNSTTLVGTAGNDVFDPGTNQGGTITMVGNGGNDVFYVHGGNDVVIAAAVGINTVITDYDWGTYVMPNNIENLIYDGTAGYQGAWITLQANGLNDTIVANGEGVKMVTGAGNDTLVGGGGQDTFVIGATGGNDTIVGFHHGTAASNPDLVQLNVAGFSSFSQIQAAMTQTDAGTVIALGGGRTLTFAHEQSSAFSAADFGFSSGNGGGNGGNTGNGGGGGGTTPPVTIITDPAIIQATQPGQVVGFMLRNNGASAIGAHEVSFGETFAAGAVPAGRQLFATINGQMVAVQMDVKTTNPDGSVRFAVLTLLQPALAGSAGVNGILSLGGTTAPTAINIATLTPANYNFTVNLNVHNADGSTTPHGYNVAALLQQALARHAVSYIQQGSQVTKVQFNASVGGSMFLTFSVSLYADGSTATDVAFNNTLTMGAVGGPATYDVTLAQNGNVVLQQSNLTQYQYQTWHHTTYSNGAPQAQVVHDIAYLEATGAVANWDLTTGALSTDIAAEAAQLGGSTYGILGSASVLQYMPQTGARPDIGPQPLWNVDWLMSQDPTATAYALAQADAAGSVPWNMIDTNTGQNISVATYANLWIDPRTAYQGGYTGLTQVLQPGTDGWSIDTPHQPDLSYLAYEMTGDQSYLNTLNAQAAYAVGSDWTPVRQGGLGLVGNGVDQVREQAWNLREVDEAAYANPNGSAEATYFRTLEANNWKYLVSQIPTWTKLEGQAAGYLPGGYGAGTMAPWEQDYFVSTAVEAAEQGSQDAVTFLKWETNFIAGRFLAASQGFDPANGISYNITIGNAASGQTYTTWAQIQAATVASGIYCSQTNWTWANGDYGDLAEQSLAGIITVTQSTEAMQAYGWLLASGAPYVLDNGGQTDVVPRLSDGQLLTGNHVIISADTTATTLTGSNNDELIHAGSGNDTINGGSGINLLFAGSGNDTINGGANNDYLFGGSGTDIFAAGGGSNFMQAGTGADSFMLSIADIASDVVAGFKLGTDHLVIAGQNGNIAFDQQLLAGATQNAAGDAVLHLSAAHSITLQGITASELSLSIFH